jgi:hypothetical protein
LNPPRYALPMGVRAVETITASFIVMLRGPVGLMSFKNVSAR